VCILDGDWIGMLQTKNLAKLHTFYKRAHRSFMAILEVVAYSTSHGLHMKHTNTYQQMMDIYHRYSSNQRYVLITLHISSCFD